MNSWTYLRTQFIQRLDSTCLVHLPSSPTPAGQLLNRPVSCFVEAPRAFLLYTSRSLTSSLTRPNSFDSHFTHATMIQGFSKAINQFLAPLLSLTSLLLILFAYLAPVVMLPTQVALVTVTPSASLTQPTGDGGKVDGPSIFLGPLGQSPITSL